MASPTTLISPPATKTISQTPPIKFSKPIIPTASVVQTHNPISATQKPFNRRDFISFSLIAAAGVISLPAAPARAASDEDYVKETKEVIEKVRSTINLEKTDPNVASAVLGLREASNFWVAKYRKEKSLLGKPSFRDMYSALNAISGHYISFGPTAPIPAKRKTRILEEMDTAEKSLLRGR